MTAITAPLGGWPQWARLLVRIVGVAALALLMVFGDGAASLKGLHP
jgi:uncharacterized membrane protein YuzA (DUF378 family)